MSTKNLLVELFVEELPPKALKRLGEAFASTLERELREEGLLEEGSITTAFASPRRLAAHISRVRAKGPDKAIRKKLMPAKVAFEADGRPSAALRKRMEKDSLTERELVRQSEGGAEYVFAVYEDMGLNLAATLNGALFVAKSELPIPKVMTYQLADGWSSVNFVRPAHRLIALHGNDIVDVEVLGLKAGCETQGHRFEAAHPVVSIRDADSYAQQMETEGAVIASFTERRAEIARQLQAAAAREGLKPIDDEALLDEVTALVERPNVLTCQFEQEFLDVPQECLILTMKANQ
ncbi:MAG: glycine--tRNA ligase subunit beta, partial [Rhodocyclaceae bacterium]|nr:glycine--tRNA ligase subunit beta [Rhodocyclaceae bacterium]